MFAIEKNVPAPDVDGRGGGRPAKYPFSDMEVGDSFAVPLSGEKHSTGNDRARVRLQAAASDYKKRRGDGVDFTIRIVREEGIARIWRIA